jgi:hypothetical protein
LNVFSVIQGEVPDRRIVFADLDDNAGLACLTGGLTVVTKLAGRSNKTAVTKRAAAQWA